MWTKIVVLIITGLWENASGNCCKRISQMENFGTDFKGNDIEIDIGKCVTSCNSDVKHGAYVSVLERILKKSIEKSTCHKKGSSSPYDCMPISFIANSIAMENGNENFVNVVNKCGCKKVSNKCQRVDKRVTYFSGTEHEMHLDVGHCEGGNDEDHTVCKPSVVTESKILGPKGIQNIRIFKKCGLKHSCTRHQRNVVIRMQKLNTEGRRITERKIIDVGKCSGKCGHVKLCVIKNDKNCLASLQSSQLTCKPKEHIQLTYINFSGKLTAINRIKSCECV